MQIYFARPSKNHLLEHEVSWKSGAWSGMEEFLSSNKTLKKQMEERGTGTILPWSVIPTFRHTGLGGLPDSFWYEVFKVLYPAEEAGRQQCATLWLFVTPAFFRFDISLCQGDPSFGNPREIYAGQLRRVWPGAPLGVSHPRQVGACPYTDPGSTKFRWLWQALETSAPLWPALCSHPVPHPQHDGLWPLRFEGWLKVKVTLGSVFHRNTDLVSLSKRNPGLSHRAAAAFFPVPGELCVI